MEQERDPGVERTIVELSPLGDGYQVDVVLVALEAELREPPLSAMATSEAPASGGDAVFVEEPTRNFDQIGGELQEMFNRAGADLGVDRGLVGGDDERAEEGGQAEAGQAQMSTSHSHTGHIERRSEPGSRT